MNDCQKEEINKKDDTEGNQRQRISMEEWVTCGGVGRLSYAILAAQSCEEDIVEMQKNERQKLVNQYSSERKQLVQVGAVCHQINQTKMWQKPWELLNDKDQFNAAFLNPDVV